MPAFCGSQNRPGQAKHLSPVPWALLRLRLYLCLRQQFEEMPLGVVVSDANGAAGCGSGSDSVSLFLCS